jgi:integrase
VKGGWEGSRAELSCEGRKGERWPGTWEAEGTVRKSCSATPAWFDPQKGNGKYGAHAFRHFFASWQIQQGGDVKTIAALMGHSSATVTLNIYSHLLPRADAHERFAAGERALLG